MASLRRHLLESDDHGRLGFHPSCPVCRHERLLGVLSTESVVARRAQAALASGVLAVSAAAPGVAAAGEPDQQQEGVAAPDQQGTPAPTPQQGVGTPTPTLGAPGEGQPPVGSNGAPADPELDEPSFDPGTDDGAGLE